MEGTLRDTLFLHYLNLLPCLGPTRLWLLKRYFGGFELASKTTVSELLSLKFPPRVAREVVSFCQKPNLESLVIEEESKIGRQGIKIIDFWHANYPIALKELSVPPPILYYVGDINCLNKKSCIAIVGSRKPSSYGLAVTKQLVQDLVEEKVTIVSGLAFGIDIAVHKAVLANNGMTAAVLPSGVDEFSVYPQSHLQIAKTISRHGCIISESPPQTPTLPYTFLARNRIIAGLCLGTVVVECSERSGALMTARYARDENRSVYAVPGSIFNRQSIGPNKLLGQGAFPATSAANILKDLNLIDDNKIQKQENLSEKEKLVLQYINSMGSPVDSIIQNITETSNMKPGEVISLLSSLELQDVIYSDKQKYFSKN